jgi:hypothetical protein
MASCLYVAIDGTSKFAFAQVVRKMDLTFASAFLLALIVAAPTDSDIQFTLP